MNKSEKERIEADATTRAILAHWDQINPDDRIAHLVRDLARGFNRSLQITAFPSVTGFFCAPCGIAMVLPSVIWLYRSA